MSHKFTVGEYTTRDGRRATVAADRCDGDGVPYPLVGWIGSEGVKSWTRDGRNIIDEVDEDDLMPPAPEMVRVPLTGDDIPQGAEFRKNKGGERFAYSWIGTYAICIHANGGGHIGGGHIAFRDLMECWEMRALGGDWQPCWKEVAK